MLFFKAISLLPFSLLYILSDFLYFIARYLTGYRKKVIIENLKKALPEKPPQEIEKIAGEFYKNLTDIIVETIKVLSLNEKELNERVKIINPELPIGYLKNGQSVIALAGHQCNWEWLLSACVAQVGYPADAVYKPLNNQFSNRLMHKIRSRFGAVPLAMKDTLRDQVRKKNIPHGLAMVADQTPLKNEIQYWTTFLNQDTPFYLGGDKIGRMLNMPVLFATMKRVKRGYYEIRFEEIASPPFPEGEYSITEQYARMLEEEIKKQPANWLWSHRRWKHKR